MKVIAVVVTYNRKKLLIECLESILNQTYQIDKLILIDNNSNDGTYEELVKNKYIENKKVIYKKLKENIGGAGGFYTGIKESLNYECDWVWIMDDDTIPTETCLEKLIEAKTNKIKEEKISFLASCIYGEKGEYMNVPQVDVRPDKNGYPNYYKYLKEGLLKINMATFVSILINVEAIKKFGLPCRQYFIWGDDSEYTTRIVKYFGNAYLVGDSIAIHKRTIAKALSIKDEESKNRIRMYYYMVRNNLINTKEYKGKKQVIKLLFENIKIICRILITNTKYKFLKIHTINRGIFSFIFKTYDYKEFKNRLKI